MVLFYLYSCLGFHIFYQNLYIHLHMGKVNKPWDIGPISPDGYSTKSIFIVCKVSEDLSWGENPNADGSLFVLWLKILIIETPWNR